MKREERLRSHVWSALLVLACLQSQTVLPQTMRTNEESFPRSSSTEIIGWSTNGPVIFQITRVSFTNTSMTNSPLFQLRNRNYTATNQAFAGFVPESMNHLIWTNYLARTNGRGLTIWTERSFPKLPGKSFGAKWNTNCLMWGMKGLTGIAPKWEADLGSGQSPITALTRRHGYTRGHGN